MGRPFAALDKSRLADAVAGITTVDKAMKEALGSSRLHETMAGLPTIDKAIKEALGGSSLSNLTEQMTLGGKALRSADRFAEQLRSATAPLGAGVAARLSDLDMASKALREARLNVGIDQELNDRFREQPDLRKYLEGPTLPEPYIPSFADLPPNPIFETNALLGKLSSDFEDMKAVTAATADVQEKQAALVAQLLAASVEGAAGQEKAAKETLRVAKISMWISLVAVLLTFVGVGAQALLG